MPVILGSHTPERSPGETRLLEAVRAIARTNDHRLRFGEQDLLDVVDVAVRVVEAADAIVAELRRMTWPCSRRTSVTRSRR